MTIWVFKNRYKGSVMLKHVMVEHRKEQDQVDFKINIVGRFKDCVSSQLAEFYGPIIKRKVYEE